jgi:proteic killer suppression protein
MVFHGMIESFADAETEKIYRGQVSRRRPSNIQRTARRKLLQLQAAVQLQDLAVPPGNRLEPLKGRRAGQHSVRINDQWRICFRWEAGAHEVEIVDYH